MRENGLIWCYAGKAKKRRTAHDLALGLLIGEVVVSITSRYLHISRPRSQLNALSILSACFIWNKLTYFVKCMELLQRFSLFFGERTKCWSKLSWERKYHCRRLLLFFIARTKAAKCTNHISVSTKIEQKWYVWSNRATLTCWRRRAAADNLELVIAAPMLPTATCIKYALTYGCVYANVTC